MSSVEQIKSRVSEADGATSSVRKAMGKKLRTEIANIVTIMSCDTKSVDEGT